MSYYTSYNIEIQEVNPVTHLPTMPPPPAASHDITPPDVITTIETSSGTVIYEDFNSFSGLAKWYDWQTDLIKLSKKHPNLLFIVEGTGESADDMWICWITNGMLQHEPKQITFNPYDPGKLKPPAEKKGDSPTC